MRIQIKKESISLSPNSSSELKVSEESLYILEQLNNLLKNTMNSSVLISGYRGSGKTTLIKKLIKEYEANNCIFVELNFSKFEEQTIVLRKLIRELYLSVEKKGQLEVINDKTLVKQIKLLYDHTFFEISNISNFKKFREHSLEISSSVKLKEVLKVIIPSFALIFSGFNLNYKFIPIIASNLDLLLFIASFIWLMFSNTSITNAFKGNNSELEEATRKSLYDNEIAEYHLKSILERLNDNGYKIVFVFDELDKIENNDELIRFISDLKPLILSNLASFIIISGQKLYYELQLSKIVDDSILNSLFSKNVHIPLVDDNELSMFFSNILVDKNSIVGDIEKVYRDSIILNSNGTLRRFINLVSQDIIWIDNNAYIEIDEKLLANYQTDSKILYVIKSTIENQIDVKDYETGVRDFLVYQLYIWIKKMKLKGNIFFSVSDIFHFKNHYKDDFHFWYEIELTELCNSLVTSLVSEELMELREFNEETMYRWASTVDVSITSLLNKESNSKYQYLQDFIEIEAYSRELLIDLNIESNAKVNSINNVILNLVNNKIVGQKWINDEFKSLVRLSNRIKHGESVTNTDIEMINVSKSNITVLKDELFEGYSYFVIKNHLAAQDYNVIKGENSLYQSITRRFDIVAQHKDKADLLFEVKFRKSLRVNEIKRIIDNASPLLQKYNEFSKKQNKLIILIYSPQVDKRLNSKLDMTIDMNQFDYNNIHFLVVSGEERIFDRDKIVDFLTSSKIDRLYI